eukprot:TRINITY_DN3750_c0_g1_i1.p1 TRINITY_DN3750_c0_g1~~TRINITY_DN3750_c0_g1_i1.p1  ORF type:complete len:597 (+),score=127.75 TRINITY_DN3750_c0_g1_i1:90-1880(+)
MLRTGSLRAREREFREFDSVNLLDVDDGFDLISEEDTKSSKKKPPTTTTEDLSPPKRLTSPSHGPSSSPVPSRTGRPRTSTGSFKNSEERGEPTQKHSHSDDQLQTLRHKLSERDEEVQSLKVRVKSLLRSNELLGSRIKCSAQTAQQLASRGEREKLKRHEKIKTLESSVTSLTELVEKLTQSVQAERSTNTTLQRKSETTEAANKRLMAENHRLELQLSRGTPTHARQNSGDASNAGTPIQQTDELWNVISELETSKNDLTVAKDLEIQRLEAELTAVKNEKEVLWQSHSEELSKLQSDQATSVREKEDLWKECESLSTQLSTQVAESTATIQLLSLQKEELEKLIAASDPQTGTNEREGELQELKKIVDDQAKEIQELKESINKEDASNNNNNNTSSILDTETERENDNDSSSIIMQTEDELRSQLAAVTQEKNELWKECERLASKRLDEEGTQIDQRPPIFAKSVAPAKSSSLQGIPTHFGFIPKSERLSSGSSTVSEPKPSKTPKVKVPPLMTPLPTSDSATNSEYSSSPPQPTESARENRRRALQEARNARKTEIHSATHLSRQQSIAFDTIMDEVGAMKKAAPSTPTVR